MKMPLPNFLIIGETKCGTTSLYDNLIQHPQILPSLGNGENTLIDATVPLGVKEVRFFDKYYNKGWDWYRSCFPECPEGCLTGEASPTYFARPTAMKRIVEVMPDVKLIVMLRNPVNRLISHYYHICSIDKDFLDRYPSVEDFWLTARERDFYLIERGIYIKSYETCVDLVGSATLAVLSSEEFFANPNELTRRIFNYLGVDDNFTIKPQHSRKRQTQPKKISDSILSDMYEFYGIFNKKLGFKLNVKLGESWNK